MRTLEQANAALADVTNEIITAQNSGEDVEIGTHMIAGQLAREVINLEIEASRG